MMTRKLFAIITTSLLASGRASADDSQAMSAQPQISRVVNPRMPAIDGGLEIAVMLSAAQSAGDIGNDMHADDLIGSAAQLDLEIGHRVTPNLTLGFYGNAQALAEGSKGGRGVFTGAAGVEADLHFLPARRIDPWISIGSGARAYLIENGDYTIGVGAELVRLQLGTDFRIDENLSVGPVIGASASIYGAEKKPMEDFREISGKGVNWTFTAGIAARFNAFGNRR